MTDEAPRRRARATVIDRDGPVLEQRHAQRGQQRTASGRTRTGRLRHSNMGSIYDIDPSAIPDGMKYQWNVVSVLGNTDIVKRQAISMQQNGWTPVPWERHTDLFGPVQASQNEIVFGGLRLEERPVEMSEEAEQEEYQAAVDQVRGNFRQLKHAEAGQLPRENRDRGSLVSIKREQPVPMRQEAKYEYPDEVI